MMVWREGLLQSLKESLNMVLTLKRMSPRSLEEFDLLLVWFSLKLAAKITGLNAVCTSDRKCIIYKSFPVRRSCVYKYESLM